MALETPHKPHTPSPVPEIDGGVIEDARERQRRHRRIATALIAAAVAAGALIFGLTGGGGSGTAGNARGHGSTPAAGAHAKPQAVATLTDAPRDVNMFGLLAAGVGWVANGTGFYMTLDGGRHWRALSLSTWNGRRLKNTASPGFGLSGDIGSNITATASPTPDSLIIAFDDEPAFKVCHTTPAVGGGAVALSSDRGQGWRTQIMPGCVLPGSLSFTNATTGFAQAGPAHELYRTTNRAHTWQDVARVPVRGQIDFTTIHDGWALGNNGAGLYHTTNDGRSWQRQSICLGLHATIAVSCGAVHFVGSHGVINAWANDSSTHTIQPLVYTTRNDGHTWSTHRIPVSGPIQHDGLPVFSAPNPKDLFVLYGGVLVTSINAGRTWTRIPQPALGPSGQQMQFVDATYGWVRTTSGQLDYTSDGGHHWKPLGHH